MNLDSSQKPPDFVAQPFPCFIGSSLMSYPSRKAFETTSRHAHHTAHVGSFPDPHVARPPTTTDPRFISSAKIDEMLGKTAQVYEDELDEEIRAISTAIEPILMVVLAVVAGGIVAAILFPIYGLANGVGV